MPRQTRRTTTSTICASAVKHLPPDGITRSFIVKSRSVRQWGHPISSSRILNPGRFCPLARRLSIAEQDARLGRDRDHDQKKLTVPYRPRGWAPEPDFVSSARVLPEMGPSLPALAPGVTRSSARNDWTVSLPLSADGWRFDDGLVGGEKYEFSLRPILFLPSNQINSG